MAHLGFLCPQIYLLQSLSFQNLKRSHQFLEGFINSNKMLNVKIWVNEGEFVTKNK